MLDFISLKDLNKKRYQPRSILKPPYLNLEDRVKDLIGEREKDFNESDLRGTLGEIVARESLRYTIAKTLRPTSNKLFEFRGDEYVIGGSKRGEVIKFDSQGRIVFLKKTGENQELDKFGFRIISEIDGLIKITQKKSRRQRESHYVIIESKTGNIDISASHIQDKILKPYSRIFESPVSYVLIGFDNYVFNHDRSVTSKVDSLYSKIAKENEKRKKKASKPHFSLTALSFPVSQCYFDELVNYGMELQEGVLSIKGNMSLSRNHINFQTSRGEKMRGLYVSEEHPNYEQIQMLLEKP